VIAGTGPAIISLENTTGQGNRSTGNGGGIQVEEGLVSITDSDIRGNLADNDGDGEGSGGGIWIGEDGVVSAACTGSYFFVTGNKAANGGGIFVNGSTSVTLSADNAVELYLTSNSATNYGGGICISSNGVVNGTGYLLIGGNEALLGGGICLNTGTLDLAWSSGDSPTLYNNKARNRGGAIYGTGDGSTIRLRGVEVGTIGNRATNDGGGIAVLESTVECINTRIMSNWAGASGGGLYAYSADVSFLSDASEGTYGVLPLGQILDNESDSSGGGIYTSYTALEIGNAFLYANQAGARGGAMYLSTFSTSLIYNTLIVGNDAVVTGKAIRAYGTANATILLQCTVNDHGQTGAIATDSDAELFVTNSIIADHVTESNTINYSDIEWGYLGTGNINDDPLYMNEGAVDYRLRYGSPCTNQGTVISWITNDIIGATRPIGQYDMGAYEYNGNTYDTDGDQMVDGWEVGRGLNPVNPADALIDSDTDTVTNLQEYVADTNPFNSNDYFHIIGIASDGGTNYITVPSSSRRRYTLNSCPDIESGTWMDIPDQAGLMGPGGPYVLIDTNGAALEMYDVKVSLP